MSSDDQTRAPYVSTGTLPPPGRVQELVDDAWERFRTNAEGTSADYIPALARVPADLFGICVTAPDGRIAAAGDVDYPFTIQSVSKPFVYALVLQAQGVDRTRQALGVNSTGLPFNSVMAIELLPSRTGNPLVNAGAIATVALAPGDTAEEKWEFIQQGLSAFAGHPLEVDEEVYASESATNHLNQGIARLLENYGRLAFDAGIATELYTRQCSLNVTARDLAIMGATLADGGVNPVTRERVVDDLTCKQVLAVMATAGLYETSGDWLFDVGLPGKSGVSGGIVTIAPGKGGMGTFAPRLDASGNSVKGQLTARYLSEQLGMNLFLSAPAQ